MGNRLTVRNRLVVRAIRPRGSEEPASSLATRKVLRARELTCPNHHRHPVLDRPKIVNGKWTVNGEFCCRYFFDTIRKKLVSTKAGV